MRQPLCSVLIALPLQAVAVVVDLPKLPKSALLGGAAQSTSKRGAACEELSHWLSTHGGDAAAVEVGASRRGGWGLITNRHVRAGEILARVPRTLACCANDAPPYLAATRDRHDLGRLSARGAVAAKVCEAAVDEAFEDWLEAQPSMADLESLPVLWEDADELLRGCRNGHLATEAKALWRRELETANRRRRAFDASLDDLGWPEWAHAQALVLSRGNAPAGLGYALVPVLDFVNHADDRDGAQRLGFRVDESDIYLIANRDFRRGAEAASSYVGGVGPLPADYALHAFGFVPDGYRSCAVRVGDHEVALTTTGDKAWDAAALDAASQSAPDGALAAAREALEALDAGASTRAAAAAIADPVRADLARSAAAGERAALVDLVGALGE
jgi:hypothetical protein